MSSCYLLTASELAALITAGYTLNSGPHITLGECQVACGSGSTHTTTCCPDNALADSLTIEFSGCATGTGVLTYSGASDPGVSDIWYGVVVLDCYTTEVVLLCEGATWSIVFGPEAICSGSSSTSTCDPFCLEFADISGNCLSGECPACESPATLTIRIGCDYTPFTVTYDADATFTPDFTGNVQVECWGAGGDGTAGDGVTTAGGGGGGGAYSKKNTYAVTSGSPYTVSVAPDNSEDTYFVTSGTVLAKSGADASGATGGSGGASGSGVGDTKYSGGNGANANGVDDTYGGGGGGSATSAAVGGNAVNTTGGTGEGSGGTGGDPNEDGVAGTAPGGGGGGGGILGGLAAGAAGRVIITRIS